MGENSKNEWREWKRPINSNKKVTSSKTTSKTRRELDDDFSEAQAIAATATANAVRARKAVAKAQEEADRAEDKLSRALKEAIRLGEVLEEHIESERVDADVYAKANFGGDEFSSFSGTRELLVKGLGMLGSDQIGERAAAALVAEKQRVKLGMTWDELIVEEHNDEDFDDDDLHDDSDEE